MSFETQLNQFSYRRTIFNIIIGLSNGDLNKLVNSFTIDQVLDEKEHQHFLKQSQDHNSLVQYICSQIWNWGWEGSDWFIKNHHKGIDWMIKHWTN